VPRALPPSDQRLTVLGWWFRPDAPSELPLPQRLVGAWDARERAATLAYLRAGQPLVRYPDASFCRFECGVGALGDADLTDGRYVWPDGLAHYVEQHGVRLPEDFIARAVAADGVVAPFRLPKPRFGLYDHGPWLAWARARGACLPLEGFAAPDDAIAERIAADLGDAEYARILLCNGGSREVVLELADGSLELRHVRAGGRAPQRFASWLAWPTAAAAAGSASSRSASPRAGLPKPPDRPGRGLTMAEFFQKRRPPDGDGSNSNSGSDGSQRN
jgi:hypothetical protein